MLSEIFNVFFVFPRELSSTWVIFHVKNRLNDAANPKLQIVIDTWQYVSSVLWEKESDTWQYLFHSPWKMKQILETKKTSINPEHIIDY